MTTTWYRLGLFGTIEAVEVVSETAKFVVIESKAFGETRHVRASKDSDKYTIRPTKRACYAWLLEHRESQRKKAKQQLDEATDRIAKLLAVAKLDGVTL